MKGFGSTAEERDCDDVISDLTGYLDTIPVIESHEFSDKTLFPCFLHHQLPLNSIYHHLSRRECF